MERKIKEKKKIEEKKGKKKISITFFSFLIVYEKRLRGRKLRDNLIMFYSTCF